MVFPETQGGRRQIPGLRPSWWLAQMFTPTRNNVVPQGSRRKDILRRMFASCARFQTKNRRSLHKVNGCRGSRVRPHIRIWYAKICRQVPTLKRCTLFCGVTPCHLIQVYRRFGGTYCPSLQGQSIGQASKQQAQSSVRNTSRPDYTASYPIIQHSSLSAVKTSNLNNNIANFTTLRR
jgi:hypothetical protein